MPKISQKLDPSSGDIKRLEDIDPQHLSAAAARTFANIVEAWGLKQTEAMTLLGFDSTTKSTYYKWKRDPGSVKLPKEKYERLSYVFGIYKALAVLLPDKTAADAWIKKPNSASLFNDQSALSRMLSGNVADLFVVRQYLDAQRGW